MKVIQSTFGVFHHFELARELERRHLLHRIYSTFPWRRLQREGLPHARVETFPWLQTPRVLLEQRGLLSPRAAQLLQRATAATFDSWMHHRIPPCDAFISLSGSALRTGLLVQQRGGLFLCDCGSTHRLVQSRLVAEEYARWHLPLTPEDPASIARDLQIYAAADAITLPSHVARRSFIASGIAPEKIHVIPYGVRLENFSPVAIPSEHTFEVLFVGGVNLRKGIPYLLQAFAALQHPHKRLRIAGAIDPALRPLLATLPQQGVEFLGPLPQAQLPALMSASHVLVLPSIEDGFGLVVPQAMACACPILVSENAGAADLVTDGVEGFHLPAASPQAITQRLQQLADDPALRRRMSAAALARVQHLGGWRSYGDQWQALLQRLTGLPAPPPAP